MNLSSFPSLVNYVRSSISNTILLRLKSEFFDFAVNEDMKLSDTSFSSLLTGDSCDSTFKPTEVLQASESMRDSINFTLEKPYLSEYICEDDKQSTFSQLLLLLKDQTKSKIYIRFNTRNGAEAVVSQWHAIKSTKVSHLYLVEFSTLNLHVSLVKERYLREELEQQFEALANNFERVYEENQNLINKTNLLKRKMDSLSFFSKVMSTSQHLLLWKVSIHDGKIVFVNQKGSEHLLKVPSSSLVGQLYLSTIYPDDRENMSTLFTSKSVKCNFRRCDKFGKVIWVEAQTRILSSRHILIFEVVSY